MTSRSTLGELWRRGQRGWPAASPVVQAPNPPLLVAFAAWIVAALTDGSVEAFAHAVFYVGLAVWAWEELTDGANLLRRVLGAGGLLYVVVKVGQAFGG